MKKALVVALALVVAVGVWFLMAGRADDPSDPHGGPSVAPPSATTATEKPESALVQSNHNERTGPSWSPRDLKGPDGKLLELGHVEPGAIGAVRAGEKVTSAVAAGYLEVDEKRADACDGGPFYKWRDQWSEGMDVIANDGIIQSLGSNKDWPETAEGISIGNSYGALKKTYGDRLSEPVRMDYGQPGVFLQNGNRWLGFLLDASPESLKDSSRIVFLEVSAGHRPGLLRDGC